MGNQDRCCPDAGGQAKGDPKRSDHDMGGQNYCTITQTGMAGTMLVRTRVARTKKTGVDKMFVSELRLSGP